MATAEAPRMKPNRAADRDPQVYHPLDRLRGIIRRYVVIEGVLSAMLFVAIWFAAGLVLDYGLFKVSGWDWVRDGGRWIRAAALVTALGLLAAILIFRIVRRLTTELSYPALALVLERKFPKVLGDRLITAVEMADVEAMGKFGYSKEMIRATIAEARERVATVPVGDVFNWKRLWFLGFFAVALVFGTVAFSYASYAVAANGDPVRFGWKFAHVTGIFAERNVALMNTPWPRRAHLELVDFPGDEMTVGRDAAAPRITTRAYQWVIADSAVEEGWRPLVWSDLNEKFVGRKVPALPSAVSGSAGDEVTVDAVERLAYETDEEATSDVAARRAGIKSAMNNGGKSDYEELQEVFKALIAKADDPSMGRTLRRLDLPNDVSYKFSGRRTAGSGTLASQPNNEFAGEINGLKEDVEFVVKAADFTSAAKRIRLIPPPSLQRLIRDHSEPAYLHHEPPQDEGYNALKGQLQKIAPKDLSLTGDRTVTIVPAGSELVLTAEAFTKDKKEGDDKDKKEIDDNDRITSAFAVPVTGKFPKAKLDDKGNPTQQPVELDIIGNGEAYRIEFKKENRITDKVEFKVTWSNKYNVTATRTIIVQVKQDQAPIVEVAADVIRKQGNFYLVTPNAKIPFNPESFIKDDNGLSKVEYLYEYWAEDSDAVRGIRVQYALRSLWGAPLPGSGTAGAFPAIYGQNFERIDTTSAKVLGSAFVSEYLNQRQLLKRETRIDFEKALATPKNEDAAPETVKKIDLKERERDFFDLKKLNLASSEGSLQTIYRMNLNVQATDNNVDNPDGPKRTTNAQPIQLRIIGESDLLYEITKEEEQLATRLDDAIAKIALARKKYEYVDSANRAGDSVDAVKVRANDAMQDVEKARDIVQAVSREFQRIADETKLNRMQAATIERYGMYAKSDAAILAESSADLAVILRDAKRFDLKPTTFPMTLAHLNAVQGSLNAGQWAPPSAVGDSATAMYHLQGILQKFRDDIGEANTLEKARRDLKKLLDDQKRVSAALKIIEDAFRLIVTGPVPTIGPVGALSLGKGETKIIQHTINWGQFDNDKLTLEVISSDKSITVPAELDLTFEKHTLRFDYTVKAGNKEGMYTITLRAKDVKGVKEVVIPITVK